MANHGLSRRTLLASGAALALLALAGPARAPSNTAHGSTRTAFYRRVRGNTSHPRAHPGTRSYASACAVAPGTPRSGCDWKITTTASTHATYLGMGAEFIDLRSI